MHCLLVVDLEFNLSSANITEVDAFIACCDHVLCLLVTARVLDLHDLDVREIASQATDDFFLNVA
jgi:hypothetical protein